MSRAKIKALEDPIKRARVVAAASANLRGWHSTTDRDWSAWNRERRARMMAWCPLELRPSYFTLSRKVGAVEARRMIEDQILTNARRTIANITDAMRIKQERERAQAY